MSNQERTQQLRTLGLTPTIQRLAVLGFLEENRTHPTADEVYLGVQSSHPTIARATVYNALDALTKAGAILRLTVDPAARYDADVDPHVHFRCRVCQRIYDIDAKHENMLGSVISGHRIESVRTYAFGVCASCASRETDDSTSASPGNSTRGGIDA